MTTKTTTLWTALLGAQKAIMNVKPNAKNTYHNFTYVSSDEMIAEARSVLHQNDLVVFRTNFEVQFGGSEHGMLVSNFVLMHSPSGEKYESNSCWFIQPEKGRPIDKALAGALTSSMGYYLRDLLQVPRQEDDMNTRDDTKYEPTKKAVAAPLPPPKPAPYVAPPVAPVKAADHVKSIENTGASKEIFAKAARVPADAAIQITPVKVKKVGDAKPTKVGTNRYSLLFTEGTEDTEFWASVFDEKVAMECRRAQAENKWVQAIAVVSDKGNTVYGIREFKQDDEVDETEVEVVKTPVVVDDIPF